MKFLISIFFVMALILNAEASLINDKKGFWITPKAIPQTSLVLRNGQDFIFEGDVCVVKWNIIGTEQCLKIPSSKVVFKAYFPDTLHDISDQLVITQSNDKKTWKYKFKTGLLKDIDLNQFTLTVGASSKKADDLLKIKAKFEKRILILKEFKNQYVGKGHYQKNITYLNKLIVYLELLVSRLDQCLENNPEILAQIRQPLQVENKISGPVIYSSNFTGHKISLKIPVGVPFEGERSTVEASVTNLSDKSFYFPGFESEDDEEPLISEGNQSYKLSIEKDGQSLVQSPVFSLGFGQTKTISIQTSKLNVNSINKIKMNLERSSTGRFDFYSFFTRRLGSLSYDLAVIEDNIAPQFININPLPNSYHMNIPLIEARMVDSTGRIDSQSISVKLRGVNNSGNTIEKLLTNNFTLENQASNDNYLLKGIFGSLDEGDYELIFSGKDFSGNEVVKTIDHIVYDKTAPVINLLSSDNSLTNQSVFKISATIFDFNPGETRIVQNGIVVFSTTSTLLDYDAHLVEGLNNFEIESVDRSGNVAIKKGLHNIVLDTIPPVLSNITPVDNIYTLTFNSTGKSNESLSLVKINGRDANLSENGKSFTVTLSAFLEGSYPIEIVATDKALNTTILSLNVNIVLKVLNIDLISISPDPSNLNNLIVHGAPGATRPGAEVRLYAGFFNQKTFVSNLSDGSFEITLNYFDSVEIRATDLILNRTETGSLSYNVDTTLAGIIKDVENNPLPGVKVTLISSGQYAVTDSSGSFKIPKPATGDQILSLDGTVIPLEVTGPNKKYSKVNIAVSIGTRQSNVLDKPIFLAPLIFDGSETIIADENSSAVVESPHALGVKLEIPAGFTTFPNSKKNGAINVAEIKSEYSAVPVLDFAKPETVYAFEPSGVTFSHPVQLTLPNVNEIPAGVQMVIMSKNSEKGIWEIDGLARVSDDGSEIVTEENGGITHFSEVYAVPLGPKVTEFGGASNVGADLNTGVLKNSIEIPSYKVFGKDLALNLSYQSTWADPTVVISNVIDVPKNEYAFSVSAGGRSLFAKTNVEVNGKVWIAPEMVTAQFYTDNLTSNKMNFTGVPQKSLVSYAMDLSSLGTGVHTYNSHFDIQLKQMVIGTQTKKIKKIFGATRTYQESFSETRVLKEIFPQDMGGALNLQNYSNSNAGKGWRINGAGKIYNLNNPKVLVEEANGETTSYAINSNIETIYYDSSKSLSGVGLDSWPRLEFYNDIDRKLYQLDNNTVNVISEIPNYTGKFESYGMFTRDMPNRLGLDTCWMQCNIYSYKYDIKRNISGMLNISGNDRIIISNDGNIVRIKDNNLSNLTGKYFTPTSELAWRWDLVQPGAYCSSTLKNSCSSGSVATYNGTILKEISVASPCPYTEENPNAMKAYCRGMGWNAQSTGNVPTQGFQDGASPVYNNLTSIIKGFGDEVIVADSGNNRIRAINIQTGAARTIAGNGQTYDNGDGGKAIDSSINHPRGLVKDSLGNIYVSTEGGFIRKIDPNGFISLFAGKLDGILNDKSQAQEMRLYNPYGMVIDSTNNFLYVADTGHHRIVKINLETREAVTVAGNGSCESGNIGDGKAALLASLCSPTQLGLDDQNNILVFDKGHNRIRRINFDATTNGTVEYQAIARDSSTLIKQADGEFVRNFRNGSIVKYDALGRQVLSQDRLGNRFIFRYNSQGFLENITDPSDRSTQYQYSNNKLERIVDPQGRETEFYYDDDLLTQVRFPDGSERNFEYDKGLMVSELDKGGNKTNYFYNQWKRLQKVTKANNTSVTFQDGVSSTIGNSYIGGLTGGLKSVEKGEVVDGITDTKGQTTTLSKDEKGFITKLIDSKGAIYLIERDLEGKPIKILRPDNSFSTFVYSSQTNDLLKKADSLRNENFTYEYDVYGSLLSQSSHGEELLRFEYDDSTGLLMKKIQAESGIDTFDYYSNGLLKTKTDSAGQSTLYQYGVNGNLVSVKDSVGQVTLIDRDSAGNISSHTNAKSQSSYYTYDSFNRLTSVKSPNHEISTYQYNLLGQVSKVIDPELNETTYVYDPIGRNTKKIDTSGRGAEFSYDSEDRIVREVDAQGNVKNFEYDTSGRLIKKILPDDTYEYTYDVRNNLEMVKNMNSIVSYDYIQTTKGSLISRVSTKGVGQLSNLSLTNIDYEYDELGNRILMSTDEGDFNYTFNNNNHLTKIRNHKNETFDFNYNSSGKLLQYRSPSTVTNLNYDNVNFLTSINNLKKDGLTRISQREYSRDQIGNIAKIVEPRGDSLFTFDKNNQIITASQPDLALETFVYDSLGNRVSDGSGDYIYDSKKQHLIRDWQYTYLYDYNGNLISKILISNNSQVINYDYNSLNQLTSIKVFDGSVIKKETQYFYDAIGRRIVKNHVVTDSASSSYFKRFVYDGDEILFEYDEVDNLKSVFTHSKIGVDDVLSVDKGSASFFYLKDHLGSVSEIVDSLGNIVQKYAYSSYGKIIKVEDANGQVLSSAPLENFYTFTGREFDSESNLYFHRARYYDPEIGRFLQSDSHPGSLSQPISFNSKYIYANNNPLSYVDPMGTFSIKKILGIYTIYQNALLSFVSMLTTDMFENDFDFTERDISNYSKAFMASVAISSAFYGVSGLIGAANGALTAGSSGLTVSGGAFLGLINPSVGAYVAAGILAAPAAYGIADENSPSFYKSYAKGYMALGMIGSAAQAISIYSVMPPLDPNSVPDGMRYIIKKDNVEKLITTEIIRNGFEVWNEIRISTLSSLGVKTFAPVGGF